MTDSSLGVRLAKEEDRDYLAGLFPSSIADWSPIVDGGVIALPMAMLVMAVFAPSATITRVAQLATLQPQDVLIQPPLAAYGSTDFARAEHEGVAAGEIHEGGKCGGSTWETSEARRVVLSP